MLPLPVRFYLRQRISVAVSRARRYLVFGATRTKWLWAHADSSWCLRCVRACLCLDLCRCSRLNEIYQHSIERSSRHLSFGLYRWVGPSARRSTLRVFVVCIAMRLKVNTHLPDSHWAIYTSIFIAGGWLHAARQRPRIVFAHEVRVCVCVPLFFSTKVQWSVGRKHWEWK